MKGAARASARHLAYAFPWNRKLLSALQLLVDLCQTVLWLLYAFLHRSLGQLVSRDIRTGGRFIQGVGVRSFHTIAHVLHAKEFCSGILIIHKEFIVLFRRVLQHLHHEPLLFTLRFVSDLLGAFVG